MFYFLRCVFLAFWAARTFCFFDLDFERFLRMPPTEFIDSVEPATGATAETLSEKFTKTGFRVCGSDTLAAAAFATTNP